MWRIAFESRLQIQDNFSEVYIVSLWVCWWLVVVGTLIAQRALVLVLRSLSTLHLVHNLIFMLQGDVLASEGVCGLSRALCSKVEVPLRIDLQSHPNHVLFHT